MISLDEILKGRAKFNDLSDEVQLNLLTLLDRINQVRSKYGKPMKVNDGLRVAQGSGSPTSWHFKGAAIDIDDNDAGDFWKWCLKNLAFIAECGLWMEHPCWTHYAGGTWCHFQIYPPKSGKRVFVPSTQPNPNPKFWDGKYDSKLDSTKQPPDSAI